MKAAINASPENRVQHTDVSFDPRDMSHKSVFGFFIALASVLLLVHIFLWGVFRYMGGTQFAGHPTTNPIMTSSEQLQEIGGDPAISFPKPNLQPNPPADLNKFRIAEEQELNTYGWIDPTARKIHIPIESAIDNMSGAWPNQEESTRDEGDESPDSSQKTGGALQQANIQKEKSHER